MDFAEKKEEEGIEVHQVEDAPHSEAKLYKVNIILSPRSQFAFLPKGAKRKGRRQIYRRQ